LEDNEENLEDEEAKDITDIRDTGGKAIKQPNIEHFVSDDPNA
jgi:hypothetical protein